MFDRQGDIQPIGLGQQGVFHRDTRHLSNLRLQVGGRRPLLLSSTTREDNLLLSVDLTNSDLEMEDGHVLPHGSLHIRRDKFLHDGTCFDRITVHNYGKVPIAVDLAFDFGNDFADIFEVRGTTRARRGTLLPVQVKKSEIILNYEGLDGLERHTRIACSWPESSVGADRITVPLRLGPREEMTFSLSVTCECDLGALRRISCDEALHKASMKLHGSPLADVEIYTSNEQFNDWLNRSLADLKMMVSPTSFGWYPYAGVPWFSTIFGRDGIITALELLWLAPGIAKGVLCSLAATQAKESDPDRDAEPGKILHELRQGEMARTGEVPFGRYYGTVDATPLFVLLAAEYYIRTGDREFLRNIWPNIEAALHWIDRHGDLDGDGFIEYDCRKENGLTHQGWKDSGESIFHADGSPASGPIALCEVQGYVYAAKSRLAVVAHDLGFRQKSEMLRKEAEELRSKFMAEFWSDELSMFALALDGKKRQCGVRSSNAGQCLFTGIAHPAQAHKIAETMLWPEMFSGWGVRTISQTETLYNPMSYHNGSVRPHDNALIAYGVSRLHDKQLAMKILSGLLDLSLFVQLHRLPELICGFPRRPGKGPTLYPVACSPQAWASGAIFMVLQACLGISIHARGTRVYLHRPALPESLQTCPDSGPPRRPRFPRPRL